MEYKKATKIEEGPFPRLDSKRRLDLSDNLQSGILKMADNNPGAMACLVDLFETAGSMNLNDFMGPMAPMLDLDEWGIHGEHIYLLWNDCLNKNSKAMIALLKGCGFGLHDRKSVLEAINIDSFRGIDIEDQIPGLVKKIQNKYPQFNHGEPIEISRDEIEPR